MTSLLDGVDPNELRIKAHVRFSDHALSRMSTLRISEFEVLRTILAPTEVWASGPGHPTDRSVYSNGTIRVVLTHGTRVVTTVGLTRAYIHGRDTREAPPPGPEQCLPRYRAHEQGAPPAAWLSMPAARISLSP